jgi:chromosome segregation ATPase
LISLQALHSESQKASFTLESTLSSTQEKLHALSISTASYNQEKERLITSKAHFEDNLHAAEKKIDSLQAKLEEFEKNDRQSIEARLKLEDRLEFTTAQLVGIAIN